MGEANAKAILFGEHAVVYGEPGIAVPVPSLKTTARFQPHPDAERRELQIIAEQIQLDADFSRIHPDHPMKRLVWQLQEVLSIAELPQKRLLIESNIPIAAGLGSGAASSVAVIRAFLEETEQTLPLEAISAAAFEIEKIYHGNPSGLDNTTITYNLPVYYVKGSAPEVLRLPRPLPLVIADSGIHSSTAEVVADVRRHFSGNAAAIRAIGEVTRAARTAILAGDFPLIGRLMLENQRLLQAIDVSCEALDRLVNCAVAKGAIGAKLTGSGRGGNIIALTEDESAAERIREGLRKEGAKVLT